MSETDKNEPYYDAIFWAYKMCMEDCKKEHWQTLEIATLNAERMNKLAYMASEPMNYKVTTIKGLHWITRS